MKLRALITEAAKDEKRINDLKYIKKAMLTAR
jgi:hypothetical protein